MLGERSLCLDYLGKRILSTTILLYLRKCTGVRSSLPWWAPPVDNGEVLEDLDSSYWQAVIG